MHMPISCTAVSVKCADCHELAMWPRSSALTNSDRAQVFADEFVAQGNNRESSNRISRSEIIQSLFDNRVKIAQVNVTC